MTALAAPPAAADLEHFAAFCERLTLDNGDPFVLEDFQRRVLTDYFAGTEETLVLLPKGNGKTSLLAALALHHLAYTDEAACYLAAASRDQAGIMYGHSTGFVRRSEGLQSRLEVRAGYRIIRSRRDGGYLKVLAADANTADGVGPTLALVDELHRHKDGALLTVFRDGLPKRGGRLVMISTAGSDENTPLGGTRRKILREGDVRRRGTYTRAATADRAFVLHEWSLRPEEDLRDLGLVKAANPLSTITIESLRKRRDSPSATPSGWARYACNVWTQDDDSAISALDWAPLARPGLTIPDGEAVWVGVDLGWKWDTTAIVPVQMLEKGHARIGRPVILTPPRDGTMLPERKVWDALAGMAARWQIRVVMDPNAGGQRLAQRLRDELGLEVLEHSQDPTPMSDAASRFTEAVRTRLVEHPDDLEFSSHVLAAVARVTANDKFRFVKDRSPIDALIAVAMAYRVASSVQPESYGVEWL